MFRQVEASSSDFLCPYRTHCFALCHCCEFDACDCEMTCPANCSCYHDQSWSTNVVDCSANGISDIPSRIPVSFRFTRIHFPLFAFSFIYVVAAD